LTLGTSDYISAEVAELFFGKKERAIHRTMNESCVAVLGEFSQQPKHLFVGSGYLCISRSHPLSIDIFALQPRLWIQQIIRTNFCVRV
jgi:hypothetical protein